MVTRQLQVERRIRNVRRLRPMFYRCATQPTNHLGEQRFPQIFGERRSPRSPSTTPLFIHVTYRSFFSKYRNQTVYYKTIDRIFPAYTTNKSTRRAQTSAKLNNYSSSQKTRLNDLFVWCNNRSAIAERPCCMHGGLVMAKSVRLELGDIKCGHYRSFSITVT